MTIKDTSAYNIGLIEESTWGTTPSTPSLLALRVTSSNLKQNFQYLESEELGAGAQTQDFKKSGGSGSGSIQGELSFPSENGALWLLLEGLLRSDWSTAVAYSGTDVSFTASTSVIAASSGSPFTNVVVGQWIYVGGAANGGNNGWKFVSAKASAQSITVTQTLTQESAGATVTIDAQMIRNGTTKKSYSIEEDIDGRYHLFTGMRVGGGSLTFANRSLTKFNFDLMGKAMAESGSTADAGSGYTSAGSNPVMDANTDWDGIYEGNTTSLLTSERITGFTLNFNSNNREQPALGTTDLVGVGLGKFQLTGTLNTYFESNALLTKFLNDTASSIYIPLSDSSGNQMMLTIHSLKYTDASTPIQGQNSDVMCDLTIGGKKHATYSVIFQIDISPA